MAFGDAFFYDAEDHELLRVVNRFLERDRLAPGDTLRDFYAALHPHGIKELTVSKEIRVAYAVVKLLDSLESGDRVEDRLNALQNLHDEVLYTTSGDFRYNTGRVLIQIMKNLIRAHGNYTEQLKAAHDFRKTAGGRRRVVRAMLHRHHLVEMPEEWNQPTFDNHVHDANTKGRKSPTHLIMDAWIKGIRELNVVYYNFVEQSAVEELLRAAAIMGTKVRVGVEFQARFRGGHVQIIWEPRGFADYREMLAFLEEKPTQHLLRMGREASLHHHRYVLRLLERYNEAFRHDIGKAYGVKLEPIAENEIISLVGIGQTSRTHLAELIVRSIRRNFAQVFEDMRARLTDASAEDRARMQARVEGINGLTPDDILDSWLLPEKNPDIPLPHMEQDGHVPEILRLLPTTLVDWLTSIRTPCHITLNVSRLAVEDVLELIYDCGGLITHLELFNLKNYNAGRMEHLEPISELHHALNEGSTVALKRLIRKIVNEYGCRLEDGAGERCRLFTEILRNIPKLQSYYQFTPLRVRIGSDSSGRAARMHGMGFAFPETLPGAAMRHWSGPDSHRRMIPMRIEVYPRVSYFPRRHPPLGALLTGLLRRLPGCSRLGMEKVQDWVINEKTTRHDPKGNIATLGGIQGMGKRQFSFAAESGRGERGGFFDHMNTTLKNVLKVVFGFALTVATFQYTQSWWVLAWFGPFIWFGITGFRNILQAVLSGGGIRRTPLLRWNDYVNWSRLCDSLLFTGLSVPLLELGVRWFLLEHLCDITALERPMLFYSVMSGVNGIYIASHNLYRGFPKAAVVGNLFRSVIAIPVSIAYSDAAWGLCILANWDTGILEQGASVISKLASDTVAAAIEGLADKSAFLRMRHWDYKAKLEQLFTCYSRLETLMPEEDALELLRRPKAFLLTAGKEAEELERTIIINALDLMYFWMYQPRARSTLTRLVDGMTADESAIFANSQLVLTRVEEVSRLFVDGLIGRKFARPLAFYLARYEEYLADMAELTGVELEFKAQ